MYKKIDLIEDVPVQYLAVYALNWPCDCIPPEVGFIETDYTIEDAISDLSSVQLVDNTAKEAYVARLEIIDILNKLAGTQISLEPNSPEQLLSDHLNELY